MMMAVEPFRVCSVGTPKFVELGRHKVFERSDKAWVKYTLGEAMPQQVTRQLLLEFLES
jgi:hypothetical protein